MKKIVIGICLLLVTSACFIFFSKSSLFKRISSSPLPQSGQFIVNLVIDYGNSNVSTYEVNAVADDTAYSVLKKTLEKENIYFEVQQYDFGVFVKRIGDMISGSKKAWIYYVNDTSADKASDKYILNNNDKVKWNYEEVKY